MLSDVLPLGRQIFVTFIVFVLMVEADVLLTFTVKGVPPINKNRADLRHKVGESIPCGHITHFHKHTIVSLLERASSCEVKLNQTHRLVFVALEGAINFNFFDSGSLVIVQGKQRSQIGQLPVLLGSEVVHECNKYRLLPNAPIEELPLRLDIPMVKHQHCSIEESFHFYYTNND